MEINVAIVGFCSVLVGTLVGGLLTFYSNRHIAKKEWERSLVIEEISELKKLYSDYMREVNQLVVASTQEKYQETKKFENLAYLLARVELAGSTEIHAVAKKIGDYAYSSHNDDETVKQLNYMELRQQFSKLAKQEINSLKNT
jgi:hypothetical protein